MNRPATPDPLLEPISLMAREARRTDAARRRVETLLMLLDLPWRDHPVPDRSGKVVGGARLLAMAVMIWKVENRPVTEEQLAARLGCSSGTANRTIRTLVSMGLVRTIDGGSGCAARRYCIDLGEGARARSGRV